MITIGYSTRKDNNNYIDYLKKTSGLKDVQIIQKINNGEKSLSQVYNEIINESKNDIIVLCHDDIEFDTKNWGRKVLKIFNDTEYGIIGLAGTTEIYESGKWWDNPSNMKGIVNHKHDGKKWESKYSINNGTIEDVVIVDGLFIAFNKNKINNAFDESIPGFHFYDLGFSFKNFLSGIKVGVTYDIRVTHLSIGQTNEQWESNRLLFAEKYKDNLPKKIRYSDDKKLNILISCLFFQTYTGSEMYVYELAKSLVSKKHRVTILASRTNGPLVKLAEKHGIIVKNIDNPPGYRIGDGKWGINTTEGFKPSTPNTYYYTNSVNYDIIHCNHKPITELMVKLYPNIDKISTIHSEIIDLEHPVIDESIKKYIAIRPEIKDYLINNFNIEEDKIDIIYNPIDENRFNTNKITNKNYVLFVGTLDYLRKNTIYDLIEYTKENNKELLLIGDNKSHYLNDILTNSHVKHIKSTYNIENYVYNCDETAGILLGRTTIEGWMCGKKGWIYNVDDKGNILDKNLYEVPEDVEKYKSMNVTEKIIKEYIEIKNK